MATDKKLTELTEATVIADADLLYVSSGGVSKKVFGSKLATNPSVVAALALKAPLASPTLTGTPVAPTAVVGTNTTQLATTAFVNAEIANDTFSKTELTMAIGNINSPLLDMPLKNSLVMKAGVGSATFTRASAATYIDRYGVLKTAAIDEPRFEKEGYLNEGASTNFLIYSEQFDNAAWTKNQSSITANTVDTLDPYGTNLADVLIENTATAQHSVLQLQTVAANTTYTLSAYVKKHSRRYIILGTSSAASWVLPKYPQFDLDTGTVVGGSGASGAKIESVGNGWFRISVFATTTATPTTAGPSVVLVNDSLANSYTGDGTSGVYIFGAQLEALPFPTSYIPTVASAVTRAADSNTVTLNNNFPSLLSIGSFIVDVVFTAIPTADSYILHCYGIWLRVDTPANVIQVSTGNIGITAVTPIAVNTPYRVCVVFSLTHQYLYINGLLQASSTRGVVTPVPSEVLYIGRAASSLSANPNVRISNLRTYDRALSSAEVALA